MSENNKYNDDFDLMMKSVLDEAREEVPAHVWEGVSAGLDKAAGRKRIVLFWRRAAFGVAAAAAVILGVFFTYNTGDELVSRTGDGDMIAVVEPATEITADEIIEEGISEIKATSLTAEAKHIDNETSVPVHHRNTVPGSAAEAMESITDHQDIAVSGTADKTGESDDNKTAEDKDESEAAVENEYFPTSWGEDETKRKRGVAITLSGVTGTNNTLDQNRLSPMMRPSVSPVPKKTGIEETSVKSSYGIPLSFGAGVKIDLSERWSVGAGVNYTYLARQFYGKYTKVSQEGMIESVTSSDIRNQQHYVGIPVNVFYDVINNDRISFYAYAGGTVEKCVSDSYGLLNTSIRHKEKIAGVQLSANAGIGVEFMLGRHLGLYIDPSVRYYFKNESQPKSIRTVQPLMLGFEMGFRARL